MGSSCSHESAAHVVTNYAIGLISESLQAVQRSLKARVIYKGRYVEVNSSSHLFSLPFCLKSYRPLESVWEAECAGRKGCHLGKEQKVGKVLACKSFARCVDILDVPPSGKWNCSKEIKKCSVQHTEQLIHGHTCNSILYFFLCSLE